MANKIVIQGRYPIDNDEISFREMEVRVKNIQYCYIDTDRTPPMLIANFGYMDVEVDSTSFALISSQIDLP